MEQQMDTLIDQSFGLPVLFRPPPAICPGSHIYQLSSPASARLAFKHRNWRQNYEKSPTQFAEDPAKICESIESGGASASVFLPHPGARSPHRRTFTFSQSATAPIDGARSVASTRC